MSVATRFKRRRLRPRIAGGAGWSYVQGFSSLNSTGATSGTAAFTTANVTTGHIWVVGVTTFTTGQSPTISDTGGNSWTLLGNFSEATTSSTKTLWYCTVNGASNGTKPTVTVSWVATTGHETYMGEFTPPAGAITQDGTAQTAAVTQTSPLTTPVANGTGSNDLVVGLYAVGFNSFSAWGGGWASIDSTVPLGQNGDNCGYLINAPGNSATNMAANPATSQGWAGLVVALTPPGVGDPLPIAEPHSSFGPF